MKVKVTINKKNFLLVELAYFQLWLIIVLECQPIRAKLIECHAHSYSVNGNDSSDNSTWFWHDRTFADRTSWSKHPMKIFDTVNLVCRIHREGNSVKTFLTNHTSKTVGMVGFT